MSDQDQNRTTINAEIDWLTKVIDQQLTHYFANDGNSAWNAIEPPDLQGNSSAYAQLVMDWSLTGYDRLAMILALTPHIKPQALDVFLVRNSTLDSAYSEFGGTIDSASNGFLPTGQTLLFVIAGADLDLRTEAMKIVDEAHILMKEGVLSLKPPKEGEQPLNGMLQLTPAWVVYFVTGEKLSPASLLNSLSPE